LFHYPLKPKKHGLNSNLGYIKLDVMKDFLKPLPSTLFPNSNAYWDHASEGSRLRGWRS
jgi:hypothetical protein